MSRDCLILSGNEFQIWGPETAKARWPNVWSRNLGTTRSPREADRRHCRTTVEPTGWHSSIRYSGAAPTKQWRTIRAILKSILLLIGSQWSSSRMAADMWLNLGMFRTTPLYLVPFSIYSTSKFLGFDLDLWPLKFIWGHKCVYHLTAHIWLPIWLLGTPSLYLVPFSRYSTSKFLGFDLDLWPLKVIWGPKKIIQFESPYMTSYLTSMDNISLSRTVFEIFDFKIFRVWPIKVNRGQKCLYYSKAHIWLPVWLLWTPSLYLVPFSRWCSVKNFKAEQNGGFWPFKGPGQESIFFYYRKGTSSHQTASFEILRIKIGSAV